MSWAGPAEVPPTRPSDRSPHGPRPAQPLTRPACSLPQSAVNPYLPINPIRPCPRPRCRTGTMGLKGHLNAGEIVEQLLHARAVTRIRNIVFMVGLSQAAQMKS